MKVNCGTGEMSQRRESDEGWIEGIGGRKGKEVIELYFNFYLNFPLVF